jgi:hypothetical protein
MVMTRGAQRKKDGKPLKAPSYAKTGGKKELTTKDGHWSGAKKGGARGDSFLANAGSTLFVLAIILTTPFIAVIVYVRSIATRFTESFGGGIIVIIDDRCSITRQHPSPSHSTRRVTPTRAGAFAEPRRNRTSFLF